MHTVELTGHMVSGGACEGRALVSRSPISFMGGVDPRSGVIVEKGHELEGASVADTILVFPVGKGSTVGSYILYELMHEGKAPKAIINLRADPIVVIGAIISEIPMMDRVDPDPLEVISTGDRVFIDATVGKILVFKNDE